MSLIKHAIFASAAAAFFAAAVPAQAIIINIDATVSGCSGGNACSMGAQYLPPNATVNLINPQTYTFGPGTYTITNGDLTGNYSAWRYNGAANWVWNFGITTDNGNGTGNVFFVGGSGGIYSTQAGSAGAHAGNYGGPGGPVLPLLDPTGGPDNYLATFTLASTTTLNFFVLDYYGPDNAGGVSLNIAGGVPEPSTWAMMILGFAGVGFVAYRRRRVGALAA